MKKSAPDAAPLIEDVTWAEPNLDARRMLALALARMSFLKPKERCQILQRCRLAEFAGLSCERLAALLGRRLGVRRRWPPPAVWLQRARVDHAHLTGGRLGCTFLWQAEYPRTLAEIHDPPVVLFWRGARPLPAAATPVAVVGTRQPTGEGRLAAFSAGLELAQRGVPTVSGLARGVDLEAHRGSLAGWRGAGCATVAVLGCGVDRIYPGSSRAAAREVLRRGWIVSEFPPGAEPFAHHFPQRNRVIAGLSRGVLVVEAPARSGALITARCAADEGREVAVATAGCRGPRSAGCVRLAESGAPVVAGSAELLQEIGLPDAAAGHLPAAPVESAPPPRQRATGAWLARTFALEQARQVAPGPGATIAAARIETEEELTDATAGATA